MIARRKFRTKEARKRERIRVLLKMAVVTLVVFCVLALLVYVSQLEALRIKHVHVQTSGILNTQELESAIQESLGGTILKLIPRNSVFVFGYGNIEESVMEHFPRVETIDIKRVNFYAVNVSITERTPEALWCGDLVPPVAYEETRNTETVNSDIWGQCFLMDKNGYIYAKAPHFSGNIYPRYYGSLKKAEPLAQQYIPEEQFKIWQDFYSSIQFDKIVIQAILFVDERDVEAYLTNGITIFIPRTEDKEKIKQRILAMLESGEIDPNKDVEYVDLRFGNKAFIKYFGEKSESEE